MIPVTLCSPELSLVTWLPSERMPKFSSTASAKTTEEWPSEKKKPTDRGRLPSHQLAGGVVDGRDVVGVERVAHAQGVGQDPGAEPEDLRRGDVIVPAY